VRGFVLRPCIAMAASVIVIASQSLSAKAGFESDERNGLFRAGSAAIDACSKLLKSSRYSTKQRADFLAMRGIHYHKLKMFRRAIQDFDNVIRLRPGYAPAYNSRGIAYAAMKRYRRAIGDYNTALRLDPKYYLVHNNRGVAYLELKQHRHAIKDFEEALRQSPGFPLAYYNRGLAYEALGRRQDAIRDYREALRLRPGSKTIRDRMRRLGATP